MVQVLCEISKGIRESELTVAVRDVRGPRQFLRVEKGFVSDLEGKHFLPVDLVGTDDKKGVALIELPHESDGGANRLWVKLSDLCDDE